METQIPAMGNNPDITLSDFQTLQLSRSQWRRHSSTLEGLTPSESLDFPSFSLLSLLRQKWSPFRCTSPPCSLSLPSRPRSLRSNPQPSLIRISMNLLRIKAIYSAFTMAPSIPAGKLRIQQFPGTVHHLPERKISAGRFFSRKGQFCANRYL
jgi:hypothetical protein